MIQLNFIFHFKFVGIKKSVIHCCVSKIKIFKCEIYSSYIYGGSRMRDVIKRFKAKFNKNYQEFLIESIKTKINEKQFNLID